ncbi:hypothetical protein C8J56DRAFT_933027, partial [Mycena floridula]
MACSSSQDGITRLHCSYLADVVNQIRYIVENFDPRLMRHDRQVKSRLGGVQESHKYIRLSWRVVQTLFEMESSQPAPAGRLALLRSQRKKIERELADVDHLLAVAQAGEEEVFYLK